MSELMSKLGSDLDKFYSYDDFRTQLKKFGRFAMLQSPLMLLMSLAKPSEIPNLDELTSQMSLNDSNAEFVLNFNEEALEIYKIRVNDMISDMVDLGYY